MSELLNACWTLLLGLYQSIRNGGFNACGIAFVVSIVLLTWGSKITGRAEVITVGSSPDGLVPFAYRRAAVPGTAKNWFDRLTGRLMFIAGMILMIVTMCAAINVGLVELTKSSHR